MTRHRFDALSLLFGAAFALVAIVLLTGADELVALDWALPVAAIGLGVLLIASARSRTRPDEAA